MVFAKFFSICTGKYTQLLFFSYHIPFCVVSYSLVPRCQRTSNILAIADTAAWSDPDRSIIILQTYHH